MSKVKFLYIIIVLLVATNVGVLINMYMHKPPHPMHTGGPRKVIIEKLGFDKKQADAYEAIINEHRSSIRDIEHNIRTNKDALFTLLKTDDNVKKDSIITNLGSLQMEIENAHYEHFSAIKSICNDDQIDEFNKLTNELGRLFAPPGIPKKPKH